MRDGELDLAPRIETAPAELRDFRKAHVPFGEARIELHGTSVMCLRFAQTAAPLQQLGIGVVCVGLIGGELHILPNRRECAGMIADLPQVVGENVVGGRVVREPLRDGTHGRDVAGHGRRERSVKRDVGIARQQLRRRFPQRMRARVVGELADRECDDSLTSGGGRHRRDGAVDGGVALGLRETRHERGAEHARQAEVLIDVRRAIEVHHRAAKEDIAPVGDTRKKMSRGLLGRRRHPQSFGGRRRDGDLLRRDRQRQAQQGDGY